jgi:hypothetical protein
MDRVSAPRSEGIGLRVPARNPAHADPQWFECDLDDQFEDPDVEPDDPLPTERHRTVPGMS